MQSIDISHPALCRKDARFKVPATRIFDCLPAKQIMQITKEIVYAKRNGGATRDCDVDDMVQTCLLEMCHSHYPAEREVPPRLFIYVHVCQELIRISRHLCREKKQIEWQALKTARTINGEPKTFEQVLDYFVCSVDQVDEEAERINQKSQKILSATKIHKSRPNRNVHKFTVTDPMNNLLREFDSQTDLAKALNVHLTCINKYLRDGQDADGYHYNYVGDK